MEDQIINFWGNEFVRLSNEFVEELPLSSQTKYFLEQVGLPASNGPLCDEMKDYILLEFYKEPEKIQPLHFKDNMYLIIGDDYGTKICIANEANEIYSIDDSPDYTQLPMRFINSNVQFFLIFLQTFLSQKPSLLKAKEEKDAIRIVEILKSHYNLLDPKALEDEESYWAVILEAIETGVF